MAATPTFDPSAVRTFRFLQRELTPAGEVRLRYGLDDAIVLEERFAIPVPEQGLDPAAHEGALALLHWAAGVSYFKLAAPPAVAFDGPAPAPAAARWLEALYSEGLGEFAVVNGLGALPRPRFETGVPAPPAREAGPVRRVLVPVGGGKDSVVALEIARRAGVEVTLFSVGRATPIERTVAVAGLSWLTATRTLDPQIGALNRSGALNGHVPVTAIVSCVALLVAAVHGLDAVALANERSASSGNLVFDGVEVNHQFSKGRVAERLLADAVAEAGVAVRAFSLLRPASELAIARAFARLPQYHEAFTSCNRVFRLDPQLRATSWCGDCDKCRFVFLILAPFQTPDALEGIFGAALLDDEDQYPGFALLVATGGHKPFECVGTEDESLAAIRLIAADPAWADRSVVRRLRETVLDGRAGGDPTAVLALSDDHDVPAELAGEVRAVLGA